MSEREFFHYNLQMLYLSEAELKEFNTDDYRAIFTLTLEEKQVLIDNLVLDELEKWFLCFDSYFESSFIDIDFPIEKMLVAYGDAPNGHLSVIFAKRKI